MAAALTRMHHALDPQRFLLLGGEDGKLEEGYGRWLVRESKNSEAFVLVADAGADVVGYVYGTLEGRDYMALRDACGVLQDIFVEEQTRRRGVARTLVLELMARFRERGSPRMVLSTAARNEGAQHFFASMGFRRTMIEMTLELDPV
jgi:ribosomal protein S18 acetylase RimI-like enzyme